MRIFSLVRFPKQKMEIEKENWNLKKPFKVAVEGNIGSGKSKLLEYFSRFPAVETYNEPIDVWRNVRSHNLLGLLYEDLKRWNFMFQNYVQLTRLSIQTQESAKPIQMFERSVQNNRYCFVEMAHQQGLLEDPEYDVLCEGYDWIKRNMDIQLDLTVYLKCPPEIAYERVVQRSRPEEKTAVSLGYLTDLHHAHEQWLVQNPPAHIVTLDASVGLPAMEQQYEKVRTVVLNRIAEITRL
ncbi:thymidine kinase 2, mitochondrial-like isoform X1 [Schistocerca serialis cubense]|uniref:thymidine kinase 2, mitochondrial-like isoform X1 n=2 Tax=Schistocerca serialis cubense TaxID=2023355 RepID=UPI00214F5B21|nr:thymidine kinase 2, mitochondrial-like isoform X1 [Schistocerca serialis cubense]